MRSFEGIVGGPCPFPTAYRAPRHPIFVSPSPSTSSSGPTTSLTIPTIFSSTIICLGSPDRVGSEPDRVCEADCSPRSRQDRTSLQHRSPSKGPKSQPGEFPHMSTDRAFRNRACVGVKLPETGRVYGCAQEHHLIRPRSPSPQLTSRCLLSPMVLF